MTVQRDLREGADAGQSSQVALARKFAHISHDLIAEPRAPEQTLELIVQLAVQTIPAADECGVSLRRSDRVLESPASTSALVEELDRLQNELGEGPCWDAAWSMETRAITDMATETRWPNWAPVAARAGIRSLLAARIATGDRVLGAVNLYSHQIAAFDNTDVAIASIFARHAASAIAVTDQTAGLRTALLTRQSIGIAQGMLMQRYGLTMEQSFDVLLRYSQAENIKLRDVAENLVRAGGIADNIDGTLTPSA